MKKVFIAVALVATMGLALVSCNKDEMKCWKVTYNTATFGEYNEYVWASQNQLDALVENWEKLGYTDIKYSAAPKYKNAIDCSAASVPENSIGWSAY